MEERRLVLAAQSVASSWQSQYLKNMLYLSNLFLSLEFAFLTQVLYFPQVMLNKPLRLMIHK